MAHEQEVTMAKKHKWSFTSSGRVKQVVLRNKEDIELLHTLDLKKWMVISCPVRGLRFDNRMLELMDVDKDGRIRVPEVLGAIDFLKSKNVDLSALFSSDAADKKALEEVLKHQKELNEEPPTPEEQKAMDDWIAQGKSEEVSFLGDGTNDALAALEKVEGLIDEFFAPAGEAQLVTEEAVRNLPLRDHINARYLEAIIDFSVKCVEPIYKDKEFLGMLEWKALKAKFAPFRVWKNSKPVMNCAAKARLDDEERVLRYKLSLLEFLENFVNMRRLYVPGELAIFQCGKLRIDAREIDLCFNVEAEASHAALAAKSNCCLLYLRLYRPAQNAERRVCAVVTAGYVNTLYVGRNGVFTDEEGKDWEAVVTKVIESPVSLVEAFWSPWRKIAEACSAMIKKFIGEKQSKAVSTVQASSQSAQAGGAAMASSVAAIGIGIGVLGTAAAAIVSAVNGIRPWWMVFVAIAAILLAVSLPSVILAWFKLRKRDVGAILNASGWAINRPMHFSVARARGFTKCA